MSKSPVFHPLIVRGKRVQIVIGVVIQNIIVIEVQRAHQDQEADLPEVGLIRDHTQDQGVQVARIQGLSLYQRQDLIHEANTVIDLDIVGHLHILLAVMMEDELKENREPMRRRTQRLQRKGRSVALKEHLTISIPKVEMSLHA